MSAGVHIRFKHDEVTRALQRIARSTPAAAARTINKTLPQARTVAVRDIRAKLRKLSARSVRATMRLTRASRRRTVGLLVALGFPISLKEYRAKAIRKRGRRRKGAGRGRPLGVQVEVTPGKKTLLKHAFLGPGGHVFERVGRSRLPIRKLFGPSIPTAMANRVITRAMDAKVASALPRVAIHELQREIDRAGLRT